MRIDLSTSLCEALNVTAGMLVSIVGAGGKTSLMYGLGREIACAGEPALVTTTTKIMYPVASDCAEAAEVVLGDETDETAGRIGRALGAQEGAKPGRMVVAGKTRLDSKIAGFSPAFVDALHQGNPAWSVIAECDGARGKSLKVPREEEPPLAASTDLYVVVAGADCLGKPIAAEEIFEPEAVARLAGVELSATVGAGVLAKSVLSESSYIGRKPPRARCCVFINKVGVEGFEATGEDSDRCRVTCAFEAGLALKSHPEVERVVYGSLKLGGHSGLLVLT